MAESVRELVVTMSLEAGNFSKTCTDINAQIKGVEAQFNAITSGVGNWQSTMEGRNAKLAALNETLGLQETKITTIRTELDKATAALAADPTLANAKKVSGLETQLNNAKTAAANTKLEIEKINLVKFTEFSTKMTTLGTSLKTFGRKFSMYIGGPLAALGIKSFNLAQDYETAMTRLQIASQATDEEITALNDTILNMSGEIPVSYTQIAELMKVLSEAGIPIENLEAITRQIEALKATSDITDENVTDMIRFMKIMNVPLEDIDNLSSALFSLGINSVATSGEIFAMANRMAATGALAGFTAQEVLALATAYTSMGINAEAGGTASNKLMKEFQLAAETGKGAHASIEQLAEIIGITNEEFKGLQETDPAGLMLSFFDGLKNGGAEGNASVLALLDSLGITEARMSALIATAANNPNFFAEMLDGSVTAWNDTTAAVEATEKAYGTSEANTTKSLNLMENAAADAGNNIVNELQPLITVIGNLATEFGKLDESTQTRWVKFAGALILFGPAVGFVGGVAKGIGDLVGWLVKANPATLKAVGDLGASGLFKAIGTSAAIWALIELMKWSSSISEDPVPDKTAGIKEALDGYVASGPEAQAAKEQIDGLMSTYDTVRAAIFNPVNSTTDIAAQQALWESIIPQDVLDRLAGGLEVAQLVGPGGTIASVALQYMGELEAQIKAAAVTAGVATGEGVKVGVETATPAAAEAAGTLADEVNKAVTSPLGIQSPSTVMIGHGINIATGVSVGILQALPIAAAAMTELGNAVSAIAAAQGAAAGAAYGGAFSSTASIQLSIAMNKIKRELDLLNMRISRGYGSI